MSALLIIVRLLRIPAALMLCVGISARGEKFRETKVTVTIDRGRDLGQSFGSLFEATAQDSSLVVGAGFQNGYNTRYRADRHAVQLYVRPADGQRQLEIKELPRPNDLCGTYLYGADEVVRSTYGGIKAWLPDANRWQDESSVGGTAETIRIGDGVLQFGDGKVKYNGNTILAPADTGSYELFFYANGYLCFYHVNRSEHGYVPYRSDDSGFSKLYACPWSPNESVVDLSRAVVLTLPIVGETTFAWGHFGSQLVTGSNIGGFYVFENGIWRMLVEPRLGVSYQLYSTMAFYDRLLMGQYPTGRIFEYDGKAITDQPGWPPRLNGVSGSAREAQTTVIYAGEVWVGVWPWGELWRFNPDSKTWSFARRMFDHPRLSKRITHPYDVENRGNPVTNLWGQRITSLVTRGPDLYVSTSAKFPCNWDAGKFSFLAPDKWRSYGAVYRLTMPGHLGAVTQWTEGATTIEFTIRGADITIAQDGQQLAALTLNGSLAKRLHTTTFRHVTWGSGVYGPFRGTSLKGSLTSAPDESRDDGGPTLPP